MGLVKGVLLTPWARCVGCNVYPLEETSSIKTHFALSHENLKFILVPSNYFDTNIINPEELDIMVKLNIGQGISVFGRAGARFALYAFDSNLLGKPSF